MNFRKKKKINVEGEMIYLVDAYVDANNNDDVSCYVFRDRVDKRLSRNQDTMFTWAELHKYANTPRSRRKNGDDIVVAKKVRPRCEWNDQHQSLIWFVRRWAI